MIRNRKVQLESRIRDIKRKMLHQRDGLMRQIWRDHIEFLESQLVKLEVN